MESDKSHFARTARVLGPSLVLFLALVVLLLVAARDVGLAWDETTYFSYAEGLVRWAKAGSPFDQVSLHNVWNANAYLNPHPPFLKVVSALFSVPFGPLGFPLCFRAGPVLFSSFCLTLVFALLLPEFGMVSAFTAVFFVLLEPRLFAEFLLGTLDGAVALSWLAISLLAWRLSFSSRTGGRKWAWIALFTLHACASATKITGFLAIAPVLLLFFLRRDFRAVGLALLSCVTALCFVALLAPDQWSAPWAVMFSYLTYPLHRTSTIRIATIYHGMLFRENTLPRSYFFAMTALTLPPLHLALACLSPLAWRRQKTRNLASALLPALLLWVLMGLVPSVPKHDGVRQFTAFLALLGLYGWLGLEGLLALLPRARGGKKLLLSLVPLLAASFGLWGSHPFELSYYSELFGGLRAAEARGDEITYALEAVNRPTLEWMNSRLPPGASIAILPMWPTLLEDYQAHGLLRPDLRVAPVFHEGEADYLLLVRRRSLVKDSLYTSLPGIYEVTLQGVSLVKLVKHP